MKKGDFVTKMSLTKTDPANQKGGLEQRECVNKEKWRLFCHGNLLGGSSQRKQGIGLKIVL